MTWVNQSGLDPNVATNLVQLCEIKLLSELSEASKEDIEEIITTCKMSIGDKIRFRKAVSSLQSGLSPFKSSIGINSLTGTPQNIDQASTPSSSESSPEPQNVAQPRDQEPTVSRRAGSRPPQPLPQKEENEEVLLGDQGLSNAQYNLGKNPSQIVVPNFFQQVIFINMERVLRRAMNGR